MYTVESQILLNYLGNEFMSLFPTQLLTRSIILRTRETRVEGTY